MPTLPILLLVLSIQAATAKPPNIILIYTDDHGWPDVGSQGIHQDLKTPHLDALAAAGVRATSTSRPEPGALPSSEGAKGLRGAIPI